MKSTTLSGIVAAAALAVSSVATADIVNISSLGYGLEGNGAFSGLISYVPGVLTITLTNDNTSLAGGRITALAFNIAGNATASLTSATHPFADLGGSVSASPYGTFEAGAGMGGSWLGGGSPAAGIANGASGTFVFAITGPGAGSMTASSFVGAAPSVDFVVRFRGFANGGSEKAPGYLVPAPSAAALMGLGLVAAGRRRR